MDAQFFRVVAQAAERLLVAEHRVDLPVIARIVFVIGVRAENGVEVQDADAKLLEIGQFLAHPFQIAAEKVVRKIIAVLRDIQEGHLVPIVMQDDVLPVFGMGQRVRSLAMIKAIDHDLIHHAFAHPIRSVVSGVVYGDLKALFASQHAFAASGMIRRRADYNTFSVALRLEPIP